MSTTDRAAMSGPEHFREAERLLDVDWMHEHAANAIAAAQVHATLAHVAVTAELASHIAPPISRGDWRALLMDEPEPPSNPWASPVTEGTER